MYTSFNQQPEHFGMCSLFTNRFRISIQMLALLYSLFFLHSSYAQRDLRFPELDTLLLVSNYDEVMPGIGSRWIDSTGYWNYEFIYELNEENLKKGMKNLDTFLQVAGFMREYYFFIQENGDETKLFTGFYNAALFYRFLKPKKDWSIAWGCSLRPRQKDNLIVSFYSDGVYFFVNLRFTKNRNA